MCVWLGLPYNIHLFLFIAEECRRVGRQASEELDVCQTKEMRIKNRTEIDDKMLVKMCGWKYFCYIPPKIVELSFIRNY